MTVVAARDGEEAREAVLGAQGGQAGRRLTDSRGGEDERRDASLIAATDVQRTRRREQSGEQSRRLGGRVGGGAGRGSGRDGRTRGGVSDWAERRRRGKEQAADACLRRRGDSRGGR